MKHLYYPGEESLFINSLTDKGYTRFIIIADAKTNGFCIPLLKKIFPQFTLADHIIIPDGEINKTLAHVEWIWQEMTRLRISKNDMVICLGGGVLTDMAAFACSVFKRGIPFVLIPTTLIGMVDASIGGKTAIDFAGIKNMIGSFYLPHAVYIRHTFLDTLVNRQKRSGIAEQIKHALLRGQESWQQVINYTSDDFYSEEKIRSSSEWKWSVVQQDFHDEGYRQALNLGHSIGHAVESFSLTENNPLLHGEAIMYGLQIELKLSERICGLSFSVCDQFNTLKQNLFPELDRVFRSEELLPFILNDKKNDQHIRMSLLHDLGKPALQIAVTPLDISEVLV